MSSEKPVLTPVKDVVLLNETAGCEEGCISNDDAYTALCRNEIVSVKWTKLGILLMRKELYIPSDL